MRFSNNQIPMNPNPSLRRLPCDSYGSLAWLGYTVCILHCNLLNPLEYTFVVEIYLRSKYGVPPCRSLLLYERYRTVDTLSVRNGGAAACPRSRAVGLSALKFARRRRAVKRSNW